MMQTNLPEEVKARRKSEYKEWKKKGRVLTEESKRRVDEEFGRKLSDNYRGRLECQTSQVIWHYAERRNKEA